ncbi:hypothetical protein LJC38_01850 [Parabacteroides sp. OttesenSCG-928-K15]|nr:hypothetical protein [Parabacteroides sp. OttesenSCG-928-K15]
MRTIVNKQAYNSETIRLTEALLARLNVDVDSSKMLFHEQQRGRNELLGNVNHYRLFFLLEGKVFLKGAGFGKYALYPKEFILLPPHCNISCITAQGAKYVTLMCSELRSEGNISYWEELKQQTMEEQPAYTALPIHNKLEKILWDFYHYTTFGDYYTVGYDTVFIVLRSQYSIRELTLLLLPLLQQEGIRVNQ